MTRKLLNQLGLLSYDFVVTWVGFLLAGAELRAGWVGQNRVVGCRRPRKGPTVLNGMGHQELRRDVIPNP